MSHDHAALAGERTKQAQLVDGLYGARVVEAGISGGESATCTDSVHASEFARNGAPDGALVRALVAGLADVVADAGVLGATNTSRRERTAALERVAAVPAALFNARNRDQ